MNSDLFIELQECDFLRVMPSRICGFLDRSVLLENGKFFWLRDRKAQIFNLSGKEELFSIECYEKDVKDRKVFIVPNDRFFADRIKQGFFEVV